MLTSILIVLVIVMHLIYVELYSFIFIITPYYTMLTAPWWDAIFEAADVAELHLCPSRRSAVVKRKLFLSPEKSE